MAVWADATGPDESEVTIHPYVFIQADVTIDTPDDRRVLMETNDSLVGSPASANLVADTPRPVVEEVPLFLATSSGNTIHQAKVRENDARMEALHIENPCMKCMAHPLDPKQKVYCMKCGNICLVCGAYCRVAEHSVYHRCTLCDTFLHTEQHQILECKKCSAVLCGDSQCAYVCFGCLLPYCNTEDCRYDHVCVPLM